MYRSYLHITTLVATLFTQHANAAPLTLPKDFRTWTHTKSMVISDKSNGLYGVHNIYANESALAALKNAGSFPVGARFVASFYEVVNDGGTITPGAKIFDAMMEKSSVTSPTGGWSYAAFEPSGKAKPIDAMKNCHQCHQAAQPSGFVFSKYVP